MPRKTVRNKAEISGLPESLSPELATLVAAPPHDADEWLYEIKFDGYRMLARVDDTSVRLISRNDNDWTAKLEPLRAELARMELPSGWYDGEIVVNNSDGHPDFGLLQNAFDRKRADAIVFYLFDAPFLDGQDIRDVPAIQRRELLRSVLDSRASEKVMFSQTLEAPPAEMVAAACQMGLEGLIGKRKDSRYVGRRSPDWIKLKCGLRQEFVVGGYNDASGARNGIGSLLLGTYDVKGRLTYAGSVGTGFDDKTRVGLFKKLQGIRSDTRPFLPHRELTKDANWVEPKIVVEVSFAEWTHTGSVRHASYRGIRNDKSPTTIVREQAAEPIAEELIPKKRHWGKRETKPFPAKSVSTELKVKVTSPERVIDNASGATKLDLVTYYNQVSELMLPHLAGRPTSLVRAPSGIGGELFFQKHAETAKLKGMARFPVEINPDHPPMLNVATAEGLLSTAQWNVIEYHTQNVYGDNYARPDRMIFDLDPGDGVTWAQIQEAAHLVQAVLLHLGLTPFLKTSGGKGLHLDVPIEPRHGWDTVKNLSKAVVVHIAKMVPDRFSAKSGPSNRKGKIFIDYLRNGRGATTACAWSARARPGLGISVPVGWDELDTLTGGDQWTISNAQARMKIGNRPWNDYRGASAEINEAMEILGVRRVTRSGD
jgi:bifunctional non-homologous end joining protein LigD